MVAITAFLSSPAVSDVRFGSYLKNTSSLINVKSGSTISGVIDTRFLVLRILSLINCFCVSVRVSAFFGLIDKKTFPYSGTACSSPPHTEIDSVLV